MSDRWQDCPECSRAAVAEERTLDPGGSATITLRLFAHGRPATSRFDLATVPRSPVEDQTRFVQRLDEQIRRCQNQARATAHAAWVELWQYETMAIAYWNGERRGNPASPGWDDDAPAPQSVLSMVHPSMLPASMLDGEPQYSRASAEVAATVFREKVRNLTRQPLTIPVTASTVMLPPRRPAVSPEEKVRILNHCRGLAKGELAPATQGDWSALDRREWEQELRAAIVRRPELDLNTLLLAPTHREARGRRDTEPYRDALYRFAAIIGMPALPVTAQQVATFIQAHPQLLEDYDRRGANAFAAMGAAAEDLQTDIAAGLERPVSWSPMDAQAERLLLGDIRTTGRQVSAQRGAINDAEDRLHRLGVSREAIAEVVARARRQAPTTTRPVLEVVLTALQDLERSRLAPWTSPDDER